ncbi:MAG: class I SAM-dependent methyltransferase [Pseudomonadota bacterium]
MPNSTTESPPEAAPLRIALLAQLGGGAAVALLVFLLGRISAADFTQIPYVLALLQGGIAAALSLRLRAPLWWLPLHLLFAPLAVLVQHADIPPGWFLAGFIVLLLVFWRTDKSRVPLFLSNAQTTAALAALLPPTPCRVLDVGCGDGGLLRRLARSRPDCEFVGIEHAPLPWLLARLRCLGLPNAGIRHGDFWREPLGGYDLVYAFLSPAPMPRLWAKAQGEMGADALLVSNSFAVPAVEPGRIVRVRDRRQTRLFVYHPDKARDSAAFPPIPDASDQE